MVCFPRRRWKRHVKLTVIICLLTLLVFNWRYSAHLEDGDAAYAVPVVRRDGGEGGTTTRVALSFNRSATHPDTVREEGDRRFAAKMKTELERRQRMEGRMEERRRRVRDQCTPPTWKQNVTERELLKRKKPEVVVSISNRFLHCPITKAASTFWFRFLASLNVSGPMKPPYSVPISTDRKQFSKPLKELPLNQRFATAKSAFRNVFVRNPYTRMFSAYVDKVYAPNPTYWHLWGKGAIRLFRKEPAVKSLKCGHNVTFAEVMSYANKKLYDNDIHFLPVSKLCQPCAFPYHIIGKMETFSEDVVFLAQSLNLTIVSYLESQQFKFEYVKDAIEDSINSPFSWRKKIISCMSWHEAGQRVWRKLQIRGIISRRISFPYSAESFEAVTSEEFIAAAVDAYQKSTDRAELKQQKEDAFAEAYSTVNLADLQTLMAPMRDDFELFDYEEYTANVFNISGNNRKGAFDWTKEW